MTQSDLDRWAADAEERHAEARERYREARKQLSVAQFVAAHLHDQIRTNHFRDLFARETEGRR